MKNQFAKLSLLFLCSLAFTAGFAQGPTDDDPGDPGFIVTVTQNLGFGAFSAGVGGGTISISAAGLRTASGAVVLLNNGFTYFNAIFELDAPAGTIVTVTNGPDAVLTGSNGGSITLRLGACSPSSPFTTTAISPSRTILNVGGTLTVGSPAASPPGAYTGTFDVYFNYQ